jgi:hypothetical protein
LYEYRVYDVLPGRMGALHARFEHATLRLFEKHGIRVIGIWQAIVGDSSQLHYILEWDDWEHRTRAWSAFTDDPEWQAARLESERDGIINARMQNQLWRATPYSPLGNGKPPAGSA